MARRGGTRYLKILRGSNETARNRLIQYFKGEITPTYPERQGDRANQADVWVLPFGIPLAASKKLRQKVNATRFAGVSAFGAGFVTDAAPTADNQVVLPGLLVCRAAITTGRAGTGTENTSKITGLRYKSYGGNGVVLPFGQGSETDEKSEDAVFKKIFARVKQANERNQCSFIPGSYSQT